MTPYYQDDHLTIRLGDVRDALGEMVPESVACVVTSPPYFSLRDYGIPPSVWGGDPEHAHEWTASAVRVAGGTYKGKDRWQHQANGRGEVQPRERRQQLTGLVDGHPEVQAGTYCECGAWLGCLGLEPTPAEFVAHVVEVFRAVRRVLRKDGTLWLNMGDSYAASATNGNAGGSFQRERRAYTTGPRHRSGLSGALKPKDRMMIPARVAIALQEDGWWLRDEIVWSKSNPMPSSVRDRTTPAHEMVYLLSRSARYHYDAKAIAEPLSTTRPELLAFGERPERGYIGHMPDRRRQKVPGGWDVEPGAHGTIHRSGRTVATYTDKQAAAAATPSGSATSRTLAGLNARWDASEANGTAPEMRNKRSVWTVATEPYPEAHFATFPEKLIEPMILAGCPVGGTVLDPFGGSGTVAVVAQRLGRKAVLIDRSAEYVEQMIRRVGAARASGAGPAVDMPVPLAPDGLWADVG